MADHGVPADAWGLPPTQALALEVLAARARLGETCWTFSTGHRRALEALERLGLVGWKAGTVERACLAWLTGAGREAVLKDAHRVPLRELDDFHWLLACRFRVMTSAWAGGFDVRLIPWEGPDQMFMGCKSPADGLARAREWAEAEGITP